jgi:putative transposase
MGAVAAYIDLNPVRAGSVKDPKDCRFCGYAAPWAGNKLARQGLRSFSEHRKWAACAAAYRMRLFVGAGAAKQSGNVVLEWEQIKEAQAQGGKLSLGQVIRLRVRHMSDGMALVERDLDNRQYRA